MKRRAPKMVCPIATSLEWVCFYQGDESEERSSFRVRKIWVLYLKKGKGQENNPLILQSKFGVDNFTTNIPNVKY